MQIYDWIIFGLIEILTALYAYWFGEFITKKKYTKEEN
jgi:hypothetical protein